MTSLNAPSLQPELIEVPSLETWLSLTAPTDEDKTKTALMRLERVVSEAETILHTGHVPKLEGLERCVEQLCNAAATYCQGDTTMTAALDAASLKIGTLMTSIEALKSQQGEETQRGAAHSRAAMAYTSRRS